MLTEARAREIARHICNEEDAEWNRIALFAANGEVELGVAEAVRQARREEPNVGGHPPILNDRDTLDLYQYLQNAERRIKARNAPHA